MAISWDVKIGAVHLNNGRADVSITRTDSELAEGTHTYTMNNTPFATPEQRAWVIEGIKGWIEQQAANDLAKKTFIGTFEQDTKVELEAWELTRD